MLKTKLNQIQMIEAQNSLRGDFVELNVSHDRYWMKHMLEYVLVRDHRQMEQT